MNTKYPDDDEPLMSAMIVEANTAKEAEQITVRYFKNFKEFKPKVIRGRTEPGDDQMIPTFQDSR